MERLQKVIANSGYCSRRKAEELILNGLVTVNGEIIKQLGTKVSNKDMIMVNGTSITKETKEYYLLNKPRGVITSTSDDKNRKTVIDLIDTTKRIYPVGRLDYDTTGILILTNDGELANGLMHPKNKIDKVYVAKVEGIFTKKDVLNLSKGVVIDGIKTSRSRVRIKKIDKKTNTSMIEITIHEGRNHQVKRMFEAIGFRVKKLKRERYDFLDLHGLTSGDYRVLTPKEVKKLYNSIGK
jgi:23S rRNA pseudouridine2605 synthase